jgi:hypothetical protein
MYLHEKQRPDHIHRQQKADPAREKTGEEKDAASKLDGRMNRSEDRRKGKLQPMPKPNDSCDMRDLRPASEEKHKPWADSETEEPQIATA